MDKTIAGAASGENAEMQRRRVHYLRQKDRRNNRAFFVIFFVLEIGAFQSFFVGKPVLKNKQEQRRKTEYGDFNFREGKNN